MSEKQPDMIIVGAGLSGLITAWRCLDVNSNLTVMMIEASDRIAGDHTWSFNLSDVDEHLQDWIKPFIAYQWDRYDVKFPKRERTLEIPYCTGNSESLRACVQPHIESGRLTVKLNTRVINLQPDHVILQNEQKLSAKCVLDARGFEPNKHVFLGYQKFVGHVIKTAKPHGIERPIIMDATVKQLGGYRFVYCLPFSETEILVEDTYYTDGSELDSQILDARIMDYIQDRLNVSDYSLIRQEKGVLPITLAVDYESGDGVAIVSDPDGKIGVRGGFYHAVTGYSLPEAIRTADEICNEMEIFEESPFEQLLYFVPQYREGHFDEESFLRLLNRMLFRAAKPDERYKVLQRFYGLSQGIIERFYAGRLTFWDKARILIGKPPVPVTKALYNFSEEKFIQRERAKKDAKT